ncbi:hypothetical protein A7U60_g5503 [Sanghuangporus baumii]|uniref:Uncharacterized protein n=1 Tax=Sanghuangporus baumii TaxID=108892 RepID=A0A9Q5N882_SANBA|nr:hypothetical protein A7U60_g5503 [Sanghuangporus baumii]
MRSISQDRCGRSLSKSHSMQAETQRQLSNRQRKFLRKLVHVLTEVIDENKLINEDFPSPAQNEEGGSGDEKADSKVHMANDCTPGKNNIMQKRGFLLQSFDIVQMLIPTGNPDIQDGTKQLRDRNPKFEPMNIIALKKWAIYFLSQVSNAADSNGVRFTDRHNPLKQHVQSLLNTLGGGGRTAKALEKMQEGLNCLSESVQCSLQPYETNKYYLYPDDCVKALRALDDIIAEMTKALREFGVFNTRFFHILHIVQGDLQRTTVRLNGEYGHHRCCVEEYLDSIFEPLVDDLEIYVKELTGVAEKEIPAIRQSQEFATQRYLNLTTIATFLSSVTATILQITAGGPASVLNIITNSFWFVSLVFSSASAIYSLLVMTWRQSPIRRPDRSLPSLAHFWLRNGPMFALIGALMTFSVGLCLLAFLVTDQMGTASVVVPTALAGFHAQVILILSAWYLFEQWRARNAHIWASARDKCISPATQSMKNMLMQAKVYGFRMMDQVKLMIKRTRAIGWKIILQIRSLGALLHRPTRRTDSCTEKGEMLHRDIELGDYSFNSIRTYNKPNSKCFLQGSQSLLEYLHTDDVQQRSERERNSPTTPNSAEPSSASPEALDHKYGHPLQFSSNCKFLASASSSTVTIYDVGKAFEILKTIVVPDEGLVKQVLWNPNKNIGTHWRHGRREQGDLLVKSSKGVFMYSLARPDAHDASTRQAESHMLNIRSLDRATGTIRWICEEDNGLTGLSCLLDGSLKVFEAGSFDTRLVSSSKNNSMGNDKELDSYGLSELASIEVALDAAFYKEDRIICLARTEACETQLLIIDRYNMSIMQSYSAHSSHSFVTVSQKSGRILILGAEVRALAYIQKVAANPIVQQTTDAIELEGSARVETLYDAFHLSPLGNNPRIRAVGCFGKDDNMVFDVMDSKLAIFHRLSKPHSISTSWLHEITTPSQNAIPRNFVSFALGHHLDVSRPYLFAFGNKDGSVKVWSILTNRALDECKSAESFEVHDQRDGRTSISTGRFLNLSPPVAPPPAGLDGTKAVEAS